MIEKYELPNKNTLIIYYDGIFGARYEFIPSCIKKEKSWKNKKWFDKIY